jgi:predicted metalloendopeptidase
VNGKLTLGENLADNGGLARALEAWRDEYGKGIPVILNRNFNLPGLNYTREQMLYVGFSQVWCSVVRPETAIQRVGFCASFESLVVL